MKRAIKLLVKERVSGREVYTVESTDPNVILNAKGNWGSLQDVSSCNWNKITIEANGKIYIVFAGAPARCYKLRPCVMVDGKVTSLKKAFSNDG